MKNTKADLVSNAAKPAAVRVEIWSDVQCVWCYIANPRFRSAVEQFDGDVEIVYRSFELHPDAPLDIDKDAHMRSRRSMGTEQREGILRQLTELAAAAESLSYNPSNTQPTNSHLALELLHHANTTGLREVLNNRLFAAYFAEGRHIGRVDGLVELAAEIGLGRDVARTALTEGHYIDAMSTRTSNKDEISARRACRSMSSMTHGSSQEPKPLMASSPHSKQQRRDDRHLDMRRLTRVAHQRSQASRPLSMGLGADIDSTKDPIRLQHKLLTS